MAQRRLAPDDLQPKSFAFSPDNVRWAENQIAKYPAGRQASAVIPLLWQAQKQAGGWLPRAAIEHVADVLAMPPIRVIEVATFYTMYNLEPVGQHFIQLCGTVPCHCMGAEDLKKVLKSRIGDERHVTADGKFSWLEVECLGACCNAPMVQINDDYYEDLTPENFGSLLDDLAAGRSVKKGSQQGRNGSEPMGAVTSLSEANLYDGSVVGSWKAAFEERFASQAKAKEEAARAAEAAKAAGAAPAPNAPVVTKPAAEIKPALESQPAAPMPLDETALKAEEAEIEKLLAALPKDASPEQKADAVGTRPSGLPEAREKRPDKLTLIKGIGPVNEGKLHSIGIFHFDQIAGWDRPRIRWVGTFLSFPGRIDRENWVAQAAHLAAGGKPLGKA
ncbi:NADH dehydrogenase subunit E [Rhabdaerophilaceae bacterium]